jgi:MFS family permease
MTSPANDQVCWGGAIGIPLGMVTPAIRASTFTSASPSIMTGLRADVDRIRWVVTSSGMTQTVVMLTVGWPGGVLGNRNPLLAGIGISLIGAALGGTSWSLETFIVFHIGQGIGASLMQPTLTAILYSLFLPQRRGPAPCVFLPGRYRVTKKKN